MSEKTFETSTGSVTIQVTKCPGCGSLVLPINQGNFLWKTDKGNILDCPSEIKIPICVECGRVFVDDDLRTKLDEHYRPVMKDVEHYGRLFKLLLGSGVIALVLVVIAICYGIYRLVF